MKLVYCGQFLDFTGYGIAARKYLKSIHEYLVSSDVDIDFRIYTSTVAPLENSKVPQETLEHLELYEFKNNEELSEFISDGDHVCIWHMPTAMVLFADKRFKKTRGYDNSLSKIIKSSDKNLHFVVWETDDICKEWQEAIEYINPNKILTACNMNKEVFQKYSKSVDVIPHPFDLDVDRPVQPINNMGSLKDKFVVLSVSQWTKRKGFDKLVAAFLSEFNEQDDIMLVLKTYFSSEAKNIEEVSTQILEIKKCVSPRTKNSNIVLISDYISKQKLNWLYKNSDAFSLLTRGEGFGLTINEAMLNELPVLVPSEGGHVDYIPQDNPFFVDGVWDTCVYDNFAYEPNSNWFECSVADAKAKLRKAYNMWKQNTLKKVGEQNLEHLRSLEHFEYRNVGQSIIDSCVSTDTKQLTKAKHKARELKKKISAKSSLEEKLSILEGSFDNETCYLLNCGPSLNDIDSDELSNFLSDKVVFSVKQAYDKFKDVTDFHFYNCSNLPSPRKKILLQHYTYEDNSPIVVASSNYDLGKRWTPIQKVDLFFKIPIRTEINNEFVTITKDFGKYKMSETSQRPCGPGIIYETVMYMALHLGFKKIVAIGWDLSQDSPNEKDYEHFYGTTDTLYNRGDILPWEIEVTRNATKELYYWLKENGVELELVSDKSKLYENIPRVKFGDLK